MAKDLTDLFGSLPDFVLQGLGPNEIFNIIQQGDPFPGGPNGPGIGEGTFFDEVNQGDPVATQQEMIQAALNQLEQEDNGLPDAVRSAAEIVSALNGSYSSDSIEDVIVDLYGRDIWGDVQAEEKRREIELFGPGAFDIKKRTLETDEELNLHLDQIITPPTQEEVSEAEMIEALSGYGPPTPPWMQPATPPNLPPVEPMGETWDSTRDLLRFLRDQENPAGLIGAVPQQQDMLKAYLMGFTPGLGAYGEVPTDFPNLDQITRSILPEDRGRLPSGESFMPSYDPDFPPAPPFTLREPLFEGDDPTLPIPGSLLSQGKDEPLPYPWGPAPSVETPYEKEKRELWEETLRDQENLTGIGSGLVQVTQPWMRPAKEYENIINIGDQSFTVTTEDGVSKAVPITTPLPTTTPSPTPTTTPLIEGVPNDVETLEQILSAGVGQDVPTTTTAVPTTMASDKSFSDFFQTQIPISSEDKEFLGIYAALQDPGNKFLGVVQDDGINIQVFYNNETEHIYARRQPSDTSLSGDTQTFLYDFGKATSSDEGNTLSIGDQKWESVTGTNLYTRVGPEIPTTAQGAVGLQPRGGRVSVADTFRDQGGRSAWKDFYELARLQGMGPQARQPRFAATASQGFGSKWGEFLLEQASLGKKGDLGFFDTYLQDEDRDISEANRNKGWGNIAQWSAYAGSEDQAERDKFYGTPHIARDVLTDSSKQDILDLISAAMGSNPDTYGGRALQRSLGRDYDHYVMQQQAKGFGEPQAGFIGFVHSQMKLNDFTEKDTVAAEVKAASSYSTPETAATSSYSPPGIGTQGSETELQKRLRYFQGS